MSTNLVRDKISDGVITDDAASVRRLLLKHPDLKDCSEKYHYVSWLHLAAQNGSINVMQALFDLGLDVNKIDFPLEESPLGIAIEKGQLEAARWLLVHGADPNRGRAGYGVTNLMAAIDVEPEKQALGLVRLLIENGADINRMFPSTRDDKDVHTPLSWAIAHKKAAIVNYLRSKGSVTPDEMPAHTAVPKLTPGQEYGRLCWMLSCCIKSDDKASVRRLLTENPALKGESIATTPSLLHDAAEYGAIKVMEMLIELGFDVNKLNDKGIDSPLERALFKRQLEAARFLLDHGANPDVERPLISAITIDPEEQALAFVKLLVEHGADVNRSFSIFGSKEHTIEPLMWAESHDKPAVAEYLRSKGAVNKEKKMAKSAPENLSQEVVAYFEEKIGPVKPGALIEIVPVEPTIAIHCVPAGEGRDHITLFTTGMSEHAMNTPPDGDEYRYAELFIQLPAGWALDKKALSDPKNGWPIRWLRQIAKYPYQNGTWLGGPATLIANDEPPQPLAPGLKFTTWLLIAEFDFISRDGHKIQLFRLIPLYTEERNLELKKGLAALLKTLDQNKTSFVVDLKRKSVANM